MAYINTSDLNERLGDTLYARLTDRDAGVTADTSVALRIVDEAQALADSYFARRYATPIDLTAHPELRDVIEARVLDLAEFIAWRQSPLVSDVPDRVRLMHEAARRWFEAVAAGRLLLPAASPPASSTASETAPRASGASRRFTHDELDGL